MGSMRLVFFLSPYGAHILPYAGIRYAWEFLMKTLEKAHGGPKRRNNSFGTGMKVVNWGGCARDKMSSSLQVPKFWWLNECAWGADS